MKDEKLLNHLRRLRWNVQRERNRLRLGSSILEAHQRRLDCFVAKIELRKIIQLPVSEITERTGLTSDEVRTLRARWERLNYG